MVTIRKQRKNLNKHTERGTKLLDESVKRDGWIGAITVAADGETFDGSNRVQVGGEAFADAIVVESDGSKPVVVVRKDIASADDPKAKRLGMTANHIQSVDYDPDAALLRELASEDALIAALAKEDEQLRALLNGEQGQGDADNNYSRKIEAPIYTPKGEKPTPDQLFDDSRTKQLIADIDASSLPESEKTFLRIAAQRHTVLNFKLIADYYAHSEQPTQKLMEDSALVIIDFNRAIELGYVKLSQQIAEQYAKDYPDA